jgi:hypothetical protein
LERLLDVEVAATEARRHAGLERFANLPAGVGWSSRSPRTNGRYPSCSTQSAGDPDRQCSSGRSDGSTRFSEVGWWRVGLSWVCRCRAGPGSGSSGSG